MNTGASKPIIAGIVRQHVEEAIALRTSRTQVIREAHNGLAALADLDERLQAHVDALAVAGDAAWLFCQQALEEVSVGSLFIAAVQAIRHKRSDWLASLIALVAAVPQAMRGLTSAFGWLEARQLRNIVARLLRSPDITSRVVGTTACALHRVDPGLRFLLEDPHPVLRALALRTAGDLGLPTWLPACAGALDDEDVACRLWGARSAVLLGDRHEALDWLAGQMSEAPQSPFLDLVLCALPLQTGHELLRRLAKHPDKTGWQLRGCGVVADTRYVPWLLRRMHEPSWARRAAEAFTLITGADLIALNLVGPAPAGLESGPSDAPDRDDVTPDPDDPLPWPDPERVEQWWEQHGSRFSPGRRYFAGALVTREHCIAVLQTGNARQRLLAAHHLCLLEPGSPLFEWRAPAWRQAQALAALG